MKTPVLIKSDSPFVCFGLLFKMVRQNGYLQSHVSTKWKVLLGLNSQFVCKKAMHVEAVRQSTQNVCSPSSYLTLGTGKKSRADIIATGTVSYCHLWPPQSFFPLKLGKSSVKRE